VSAGYAKLGLTAAAARSLARRAAPMATALRFTELERDITRLDRLINRLTPSEKAEITRFRAAAAGQFDVGNALTARTVVEALLYLDMTMPDPEVDQARYVSADRVQETYVLRFDGPYRDQQRSIHFHIPVRPTDDYSFGDGRSTIIDSGQWIKLAADWNELAATMVARGENAAAVQLMVRTHDAVDQALAFVPDDGDEIADDGVWTDETRRTRTDHPDMFHRTWLETQLTEIAHSATTMAAG
jgi:hypothetical protein